MALSKIDVANMLTGVTPVANGGTAATTLAGAGLAKRPNASPILLNGDMAVAQRGTSTASITSAGYYTCDRFKLNRDGIGTWTVIQESLTSGNAYNNGFRKAFRMDCTSATASPSADNNLSVLVRVEGQDLQLFKKGTSNAEKFTLAFWVKSNKTGTSQVNLRDNDNTRLISATYAISSANTWEHKVLNFAADTTGAFDNDNALSLQIEWFLDSGTDFSSGTAPTAWEAANNTDRNANNLALGNSTDNDWAITGVQLEVGEYSSSTLPPFQHESFGDNLARCQRYFQKVSAAMVVANHTGGTLAVGATNINPMRANPTAGQTGTLTINDNGIANFTQSSESINLADGSKEGIEFGIDNFSGMTNRRVARMREGGEDITLNAEL